MRARILTLALALSGCLDSGGGGTPPISEVEPNDTTGVATYLGEAGTHGFSGVCPNDADNDIFEVSAAAGTLIATLSWDDGGGEDLDLEIFNQTLSVLETDTTVPPNDSPAEVTVGVAAETIWVEVQCYNTASVRYSGTVTVP